MTRTYNSIRNIKYAVVGQIFGLLISFLSRTLFVKILGSEYLGINGLFSNILSMISLAELGIGSSIIYSLYKPIADRDVGKIKSLMHVYKKAYIYIGIFIACIGVLFTPFISFFIKDLPNVPNIRLIFVLFVVNSSISYFFSYKRSLIIADQKKYITTLYRYGAFGLLNVVQIVILLSTGNYILFLSIQIISTFLENYFVSRKADKLYPYLRDNNVDNLDTETKNTIIRNVKAMSLHKIGGVVVNGTDNLILSKFIGIIIVGLYSNYLLIITALNTIISMIFQSITSSIGNLGVTESKEKMKSISELLDFIGFWIYGFSSICLIILINPFINIWLGNEYSMPFILVLLIVLNFYLKGMRQSVVTFKDALGLYWYDRYKPILESVINFAVSIILVMKIGAAGVFIGTAVSTILTCLWIEPYVLYKYGLNNSVKPYFVNYIKYTTTTIITGVFVWFISTFIIGESLLTFTIKLLICFFVPNVIFMLVFKSTKEFKYLANIIKSKIQGLI